MPFHLFPIDLGGSDRIKAAMQIGEDIRKKRQQAEQDERDIAFSDALIKSAKLDGRIGDEEYSDYLKAPAAKKHSIAIAYQANMADDFKRQQLADQILARKEIAADRNQSFTLDPSTQQRLDALGIVAAPTSRHSIQYIDTRKNANQPDPGSAVYDDEGQQIGVYDAKGKITKLPTTKTDPMAAQQQLMQQQELQGLDRQIADLQGELAKGNQKFGPDWNPLATPYADQLRGLLAKRAALTGGGSPAAPQRPATSTAQPLNPSTTMDDITGQTPLPVPTTTAAPDKFVVGKKYKDKQGNEATYLGNGQWQ